MSGWQNIHGTSCETTNSCRDCMFELFIRLETFFKYFGEYF